MSQATKLLANPNAQIARMLTIRICLCWIALLPGKLGFVSQNSTYALEQGRMGVVQKNVKGMGRQA